MAQTLNQSTQSSSVEHEKLGVMLGFLAGLGLALGLVYDTALSSGLPEWLSVGLTIAVVAVCTRAGLGLGRSLG